MLPIGSVVALGGIGGALSPSIFKSGGLGPVGAGGAGTFGFDVVVASIDFDFVVAGTEEVDLAVGPDFVALVIGDGNTGAAGVGAALLAAAFAELALAGGPGTTVELGFGGGGLLGFASGGGSGNDHPDFTMAASLPMKLLFMLRAQVAKGLNWL